MNFAEQAHWREERRQERIFDLAERYEALVAECQSYLCEANWQCPDKTPEGRKRARRAAADAMAAAAVKAWFDLPGRRGFDAYEVEEATGVRIAEAMSEEKK